MKSFLKTLVVSTLPAVVAGTLATNPPPAAAQPAAQSGINGQNTTTGTNQSNTQIAVQDQNRQMRELIGLITVSIQPSTWRFILYPGVPLVGPQTSAPTSNNNPGNYAGPVAGVRQ